MAHLALYYDFIELTLFFSKSLIFSLLEPSNFDKMAEIEENITKIVYFIEKFMIGQCSHKEICKKLVKWGFP